MKPDRLVERDVAELRPYAGNARTHSKRQVKQIVASIERFGFTNPVLISDDGEIIAGHGRVEAAKLLGMKTVPTLALSHLSIRFWFDQEGRLRDRALFDLAIDSKLRGCDLVRVRTDDVVSGNAIRDRATIVQRKTGRPVQFEILEPARSTLLMWLERRGGALEDFVFPSRIDHSSHLSTRQYGRLVDEWVSAIGLKPKDYGTHSLRRTKVSMIYKQTGNLRAVQILLGHSKIESTVRYLGVDIEDALEIAEATEV